MRCFTILAVVASVALLGAAGCGDNERKPVSIGGSVSGLVGTGLVLQNNGHDDLEVTADGTFKFAAPLTFGSAYAVTVKTQPSSPMQTCVVANGNGTGLADVTNVAVTCMTGAFTVGGTVSGLTGTGLVLENNGTDDLSIAADGTFAFATKLATGVAFAVTIKTQPTGPTQSCTVSGGTGTIGTGAVTTVVVNCAIDKFTIGGTISGLAGTLVLQDNGGDDLTVTANGTFAFGTPIGSGGTYLVTVLTQPGAPSQTCDVTAGSGTVTTADITTVVVTCTTNRFTIGGTLSGLATGESVVLRDNGADDLTVGANGDFTFATTVPSGQMYAVTVLTNPASPVSQTCLVTNDSGTVAGTNVTNVVVTCTTNKFTVGGNVTGVVGSGLVLRDNGGDDLAISSDGPFTFVTPVASGATYAVTVATQPTGQACSVAASTGTIGSANVTTVIVTCQSSCRNVNGVQWCYDAAACGESCNQVCAALGLPFTIDDTTWFNAQNTAPQCQAINDAFGLGGTVQLNAFTYACSEDTFTTHTAPGGLAGPLLCSTFAGCTTNHRTGMDQLGVACGPSSRRSVCPCQ